MNRAYYSLGTVSLGCYAMPFQFAQPCAYFISNPEDKIAHNPY